MKCCAIQYPFNLMIADVSVEVADVSVEVAAVDSSCSSMKAQRDAILAKLLRRYERLRRREERARKLNSIWSYTNMAVIGTAVVFVLVIIMWALLWVFIFRRDTTNGVYFAGIFRVANEEFVPEYRQADSHEFVSMASRVQHVVSNVYKTSSVSKLFRQAVISDLSTDSKGGVLVHFWMVFVVPHVKSSAVCEDCVSAILRDSIHTSLQNRSSVGLLLGLPVDIDSILVNSAQRSEFTGASTAAQCTDKLYSSLAEVMVPLKVFSSWGGLSCHIKLTSAPGTLIRLTIKSLHMEPSSCLTDSLTVYDTLLPMRGRILHKACEPVSQSVSVVSSSNAMLLFFRLTHGSKSFFGHFEAIKDKTCVHVIETAAGPEGQLTSPEGQLTSPFYPSLLPPQCACSWTFQTPRPGLGVALTFQNYILRLKDLQSCEHGWWKINEVIYCGMYISHATVFRISDWNPEVVFRCSSRTSEQPFTITYSSFNISQPCPDDYFLCATGLCVDTSRRCDGLDDCQDESDELFCSSPSKSCDGSGPLHPVYVCNGESECSNGRDEANCTKETPCTSISYRCGSGTCIPKRNARCDGVPDCHDNSDEEDCACGRPALAKRLLDSSDVGGASSQQGIMGSGVGVRPRVVGGVNALDGEWPWQVSLLFGGHLYCGACVLNSDWLLSAAHCFSKERLSDPHQWAAHMGMLTQGSARYVADVRRIVLHQYYNGRTFDYDIALLQLRRPWPPSLAAYIQPACLPPPSQTLKENQRCWVTGWGYRSEEDKVLPSVLQKAEVGILSQTACKKSYGPVSPRMLCAGVPTGEQDACRGDSGGPLVCRSQGGAGGRWFLTGIVSWGAGCGRPNLPGVYTKVAKFTDWIHSHIH
ncbi:transmembrane protease serine 7 [Engraulis encrasicolus]|uniref:transmembrane protease serine 7 n=1 Tax=Engraulis encrasicolus TaxID=184585 RepID=UPI002FD6A558